METTENLPVSSQLNWVPVAEWLRELEAGHFEQAVLLYFQSSDWAIFPDIIREFEPTYSIKGKGRLWLKKNLLLWEGLSQEFCSTFVDLLKRKELKLYQMAAYIYRTCGPCPNLSTLGYHHRMESPLEPRWVPVAIRSKEKKR